MSFQELSINTLIVEVGLRLRAARLEANLSQEELARLANVSRSTIKRLESGGDSVSLVNLLAILQVLGRLDDVIGSLPEPNDKRQRASKPRS